MIRIGEHCLKTISRKSTPNVWFLGEGTIIFNGPAYFSQGIKICVDLGGILEIGKGVSCTGNSEIICNEKIIIGDNSLISWNVLIMDTDGHQIVRDNGDVNIFRKPIYIGDRVWIGSRVTILKGSHIADNCIISSGSIINRKFEEANIVIGNRAKSEVLTKINSWK